VKKLLDITGLRRLGDIQFISLSDGIQSVYDQYRIGKLLE
jgi:hypothetical protein